MWLFKGAISSLGPILLALVVLCPGCVTKQKALFTATGPSWTVRQGQALWQPRRGYPEIAGDLILATHPDGRCFVEFAKPPMSLVSVQTRPDRWLVYFPPRETGFKGRGAPSTRFLFPYLPAALAGEKLPKVLLFRREPGGGWRFDNTRSGETLSGFLEP